MDAVIGYVVGLGGLAISALSMVIGYLRTSKSEAAEVQRNADKLESISAGVNGISAKIDALSEKIDDHSTRLTALETEVRNMYRRIDKVEQRCETHFGKE